MPPHMYLPCFWLPATTAYVRLDPLPVRPIDKLVLPIEKLVFCNCFGAARDI